MSATLTDHPVAASAASQERQILALLSDGCWHGSEEVLALGIPCYNARKWRLVNRDGHRIATRLRWRYDAHGNPTSQLADWRLVENDDVIRARIKAELGITDPHELAEAFEAYIDPWNGKGVTTERGVE